MLRDAWLIARKDLTIEWRSRITIGQVAPLGLLILVVFAFAFDANAALLAAGAGGLYWVAVLFGGVLLVQRSFDVEGEDGNQDALRLSGIEPGSIFLGKAAALMVQLITLELVLGAGVIVFFDVGVERWGLLLCSGCGGTLAFAVCGTLYGALASGVRVRDTLLPLLLIPVVAPVLLAGTRAYETAFGVSTGAGWNWTGLLFVIAAVYTAVGLVAF
ncbi:MAG: heme exporter protein CcmB, partial [Actinomycetota bacterium]|nr:heme exporter protein CcmB [Actinomycetota bacterium]